MTDNTNVFEEATPATEDTKTAATLPTELEELVGEGKKYADVNTALKSVPAAQAHISKLEKELEEARNSENQLKTDLAARTSVEEALKAVGSQGSNQDTPAPQVASQGVKPEDLETSLENLLVKKEKEKLAKANATEVRTALDEAFGEKAKEEFTKKAAEAGMSVGELNALANKSPKIVLGLFDNIKTPKAAPRSTVNTETLAPKKGILNSSDKLSMFKESAQLTKQRLNVED